jgi:cell division protease FtsH
MNMFKKAKKRFWGILQWFASRQRWAWGAWGLVFIIWMSYDVGRVITQARMANAVSAPEGVVSLEKINQEIAKGEGGGRILILTGNTARWIDQGGKNWEIQSFADDITQADLKNWKANGVDVQGSISVNVVPIKTKSGDLLISSITDLSLKFFMLAIYILIGFVLFGLFRSGKRFKKIDQSQRPDVRIDDVAGQDGPKQELMEVVDYLRNPERFKKAGALPPQGVLLYGPPGTGKTLLAKAIAGEAEASFIEQNASAFVRIFAGAGADSVRKLFAEARKSRPCVIFIDEIDAVGGSRSSFGSHDERIQCLNALLAEMDGFADNTGIVVVAATNRLDSLDEALVRYGRFDRKVNVPLPGREDRVKILAVHAKKRPNVQANLEHWADQTQGFSGADLEGLVNEAAIEAARQNGDAITDREFAKARDRILLGARDMGRKLSPKDQVYVAHHEMGHAAIRKYYGGRVEKVSILPRSGSLGVTISVAEEERLLLTPDQVRQELAVLMGGRAAEQVFFKTITGGAADDMQRASKIAREAIHRYGFDGMGPYVPEHESLIREGEMRASEWVNEAYQQALLIIETHKDEIGQLATLLVAQEELDEDTLDKTWNLSPPRLEKD